MSNYLTAFTYTRNNVIALLQVYTGTLADGNYGETMANWFYDLPTTNLRRNSYIYPSSTGGNLRIFNLLDVFGKTRFRASPATYLYSCMFLSLYL